MEAGGHPGGFVKRSRVPLLVFMLGFLAGKRAGFVEDVFTFLGFFIGARSDSFCADVQNHRSLKPVQPG